MIRNWYLRPVKFKVKQLDIPGGYSIADFSATEIVKNGFIDISSMKSMVEIGSYKLYITTVIYTEFISSVANNDKGFNGVSWGVKRITNPDSYSQSVAVREFLIDNLGKVLKSGFFDYCQKLT